jgi:hypothetical protein
MSLEDNTIYLDLDTIPELDAVDDVCQCIVAVKIKDGGQICQLCKKDAYENRYVFSHTVEGQSLLEGEDDARVIEAIEDAAQEPVAEQKQPVAPAIPALPKEKKTRKTKAVKTVNPLLEVVQFIQLAQRSKGDVMMTHCCMRYGTITAFDRTIAAGVIIKEDDLSCFPDTALLLMALSRCGEQYRIVQQTDQLFIQSGDFSAYIPLTPGEGILTAVPDPAIAPCGEEFKAALKSVGILVKDAGATLLQMAIQLNPAVVVATNGQVIIAEQHGYDMPPFGMLVPKRFADVLNKTKKKIVSFGFSADTFTIHFEDRSWLRTNLYKDKFKEDLLGNLNTPSLSKQPIPQYFFDAAAEVANWSEDGKVYCFDGRISSHPPHKQNTGCARTFAMSGFDNRAYSAAALKLVAKKAVAFDNQTVKNVTLLFGERWKGAVRHEDLKRQIVEQVRDWSTHPLTDDDIPF